MSSNFSPEIQAKRKQFRNEIRRNELDDYRRRKRQELFGYSMANSIKKAARPNDTFNLKVPQQFSTHINESPFPFNKEFQHFLVGQFQNALKNHNFSLQAMNQVLLKLVQNNLGQLANADKFSQQLLFSVLKILKVIMTKLREIPLVSILRVHQPQMIEQIYHKVFYSLKNILKGIITEQQHQEQSLQVYERRLAMYNKMQNGHLNSMGSEKHQAALQNMAKLIQNPPNFRHPLQCCIKQVSQLLEFFFNIYEDANSSAKINNSFQTNQQTNPTCIYLQNYSILWYLASFMRSELFTGPLFKLLHGQLRTLKEFDRDMINILISTLSNFIHNESQLNKIGGKVIRYENQFIEASFVVFECCLKQFDLDTDALTTIAKAMTHAVVMRKTLCHKVFYSSIFQNCIEIVKNSQDKLIDLAKQHVQKKTPHSVFERKAEEINLKSQQRHEIYIFLGVLFCSIDLKDVQIIEIVKIHWKNLMQIIYFEYNKILVSEVKDKALIAAIDLESMEQKEKTLHTVLYLQFNLFSFSPQIIEKFIENNVLMYFMGIWQHLSQVEENLQKHNEVLKTDDRLNCIKKIQYSIISAIWNILVQFRFSDKDESQQQTEFIDRSEGFQVIIQFKELGLVKLLISYLKSVVYDTDSLKVNKESVIFAILSLIRFFKFILFSSQERYLCECLSQSQNPVSTVNEVLSRIMHSEHVFEESLTNKALKCLQLFDQIIKSVNYNEEQEFFDRGYHEQEYQNYYQQENEGNWNNNHNSQGNQNNNNQGNQSNQNYNQNYKKLNCNGSEDVEI